MDVFSAFAFVYALLYFAPFFAGHFAPGWKTIATCVFGAALVGAELVVLRRDDLPFFAAIGSKLALDMTISFALGLLSRAIIVFGQSRRRQLWAAIASPAALLAAAGYFLQQLS
ncbi:hypothetical protein [Methylopila sp. M107]|uniref:hypothetical protein n=1 Tax=Methylopila sp. M107 TaxID=1101190 RepID=UPI00036E1365|nr:hypothetical protein [Methylopila sp. M107]